MECTGAMLNLSQTSAYVSSYRNILYRIVGAGPRRIILFKPLKLSEGEMITPNLLMRKLRLNSGLPKVSDLVSGPSGIQTLM